MRVSSLFASVADMVLLASVTTAHAEAYGEMLEGFDYPHARQKFDFTSQGQKLSMAYMVVAPKSKANGRTAVLMHGKNFCGATWDQTITELSAAGYRVIVPDQVGFCSSSKPRGYQFSFQQLAANTKALLASLSVERAIIVGHSMGGMLATRFALSYPQVVECLVLVNPLGLEDWQALGVPYATIDSLYQTELKTSFDSIKAYQLKFYYHGHWRPEYDRWVTMLAGLYDGPGKEAVAFDQAQTSEMLFTQPVVHEFANLKVPVTLMIGGKDRTAPGANRAAPGLAASLGNYPELGRRIAKVIPNAELVEWPELGHSPQIEAPDQFHAELLKQLAR